ncbi:MAG: hypothetical protein CBD35_06165 [Verrucomicrobia bacterium TMED175]|nr:MAG: hypothetical protein CBD35_06165 [Verrucomicrobia bacterium TMED175]
MPGMGGLALLKKVRTHSPKTARMVVKPFATEPALSPNRFSRSKKRPSSFTVTSVRQRFHHRT